MGWRRPFGLILTFITLGTARLAPAVELCPTLLTTSFGIRGPLIATLEPDKSQITFIRDGFALSPIERDGPAGDGKVPRFEREETSLPIAFRPTTGISSMRFPGSNGDFFATVS